MTVCVAVGRLLATTPIWTLVRWYEVTVVEILLCGGLLNVIRFSSLRWRLTDLSASGFLRWLGTCVTVSMCRFLCVSVLTTVR